MSLDCTACGRTNVTEDVSINVCNRINCPPFDHYRKERRSRWERTIDALIAYLRSIR